MQCKYYDLTANVGLDKMINININRKRRLLDVFNEYGVDAI